MSIEIRVPSMGESITEATVGTWLKKVGDPVSSGEAVLELETDKVNLEVPAPEDGTLEKIEKEAGESVTEGVVLGTVAEGQRETTPAAEKSEPQPQGATQAATGSGSNGDGGVATQTDVDATPVARRLASQYGVPLEEISGTGREGRIVHKDVEAYIEKTKGDERAPEPEEEAETEPSGVGERGPGKSATAPSPTERPQERVKLSRRRQTIAERLTQSHLTAVMTTTFNEVDMSSVIEFRKAQREAFKERHGVDLGFMSFFVKADVGGLKAYPRLNSELQDDELLLKYHYDIGIAVSSDDGLVVPVLRDADRKSFAEIESAIAGMVQRTRDRKLSLDELQGGTFTITNGGVFGSVSSTPVLNAPQVAILGMHRIQERPVAVDGKVEIRPMMNLAVTYDHRVVDGADAVRFLVRVKELLEDVGRALLDV